MNFSTPVSIPAFPQQLTYTTPVLLLGSCFAENIGNAMLQRHFPVTVNPFGTVYNPLSIAQSIERLRSAQAFNENEVIQSGDLYTTFFHHSRFSHPDKNIFLQQANEQLRQGAEALRQAECMIVTLGTSWVYRHRESGQVVNNCHKIPAVQFDRFLLTVDEVVAALQPLIASLPVQWIFTVSPIRHWKDGAHGNQLSKSTLLLAIEKMQRQNKNAHYFPAYEIMMDELRDYRFYADDMLHPSPQAVEYIWERFAAAVLSDDTKKIRMEVEKIVAMKSHRLLHPGTAHSRQFLMQLQLQIDDFRKKYPCINL